MSDDLYPDDSGADIPLAETLHTLRRELELAQLQSKGEGILFEMDKVELELKVVVSRKTKGQGGIAFYVVKAGGEIEKSGETTHTIRLTLTPVGSELGDRIRVSAQTSEKPSRE